MLRDAWLIGLHDVKLMLRQRETILWTFLMPFVFFYFIGTVTGGSSFTGGSDKIALRIGDDAGFLADEVVGRLEDQGFEVLRPDDDPESELAFEDYTRQLTIPAGFTDGVLAGEQQEIVFHREDSGLSTDYDRFRLGRAVYTVLADVVAASNVMVVEDPHAYSTLTPEDMQALHDTPRALTLEVSHAGTRKHIPTGFEQAVPGTMVMFTLIILLTSGATSLLSERNQGLLRRLASAPIRRGSVVAGKWGGKLALAIVQVGFAMVLGRVLFGVDWGGSNFPMVALVMLAYASLLSSIAMLLGNYAKTEGQAVGLGVLSGNVLAALGGCWWPIEITPEYMQKLALFLPTGWAMDAMHKLVSFGANPTSVLPHVIGMFFLALLLGQVCARKFRFS